MLNECVSYLVAPHNMTFDKKTIGVYGNNKAKVIDDCDKIIKKYDEKWSKKMKGMGLSFDDSDEPDAEKLNKSS